MGIFKHKVDPFFIPTELGGLFALYYSAEPSEKKQCILHIPAFAEEMNKARHMVAIQSQAFAEQGYAVLVLDLWGTGDSEGEFCEATWDIWQSNISSAIQWLESKGYDSISLWGLRLGALLAMDYLNQNNCNVERLICWQPVLNGELYVSQFLRLRVAAAMITKNKSKEKTVDLKKQIQEGEAVEVSGYLLNPELIIPLLSVQTKNMTLHNVKKFHILELTLGSETEESYATTQWVKQTTQQGIDVTYDVINSPPFWATQEISESANLITLSSKKVSEWI